MQLKSVATISKISHGKFAIRISRNRQHPKTINLFGFVKLKVTVL